LIKKKNIYSAKEVISKMKHEKTSKKFFVSQKSQSDFLGQKKFAIQIFKLHKTTEVIL